MRVVCTAGGLRAVVGWPLGVVGALPAEFKPADETELDFGRDVAVGLDQPIGQVVAQPLGLRDFGNIIGDQPGLMATAQTVESEPGSNRLGAFPLVAVHGRPKHTPVEIAATQWMPLRAGEHEVAGRDRQVHLEQTGEKPRQRDRARRRGRLRRTQPQPMRRLVQRTRIRVDRDRAPPQIDMVALQASELTPPGGNPSMPP